VPTGTVDLMIRVRSASMCEAICRATLSTWVRSAEPSSSAGVPTAMKINSACSTASLAWVLNSKRPALMFSSSARINPVR
jgi:hypothetical protein